MIISYIALGICFVGIALWGLREVKQFLVAYSTIDSAPALEAFKRLARRNMIVTLIYLPFGLVSLLWSVYLVFQFALQGLVVVLAVQTPVVFFSFRLNKLEGRARSLDAANDTLKEEHRRVAESWVKKALPDF